MSWAWKDYRLAPVFINDHRARDLPERGVLLLLGWDPCIVRLDEAAFSELLSDAQHYADPQMGYDLGLRSSARAVVRNLMLVGPPAGHGDGLLNGWAAPPN